MHQARAFFITRTKGNFKFLRRYSQEIDKATDLPCNQTVVLTTFYPAKAYPEPLRRIRYVDPETEKRLVFLTNNFDLPALTVAMLYKARWRIELFFKWIKQHLRIKVFYGNSENAIQHQIWSAIATYLLVAILKKERGLEPSLYTILQALSLTLFEKIPVDQLFSGTDYDSEQGASSNQLSLFDF